jgi:hypothetical protein
MIDPALARTQIQLQPEATTENAPPPAHQPSPQPARTLGGLSWLSVSVLLGGVFGLAAVCAIAGYLAGRWRGDQDIQAASAETEEEKAELLEKNAALQESIGVFEQSRSQAKTDHERTVQRLEEQLRIRGVVPASGQTVAAIGSASPGRGFRPAAFNPLSLNAFLEKTTDASHQRQPKLIVPYVGDRFEWVGYVYSVSTPKNEQDPLMIELGPDDHAFRPGSTVRCLFPASDYGEMIDNLKVRRRILIAGVMTADGHLENCRLLMTMNPARNLPAPTPPPKARDARPPVKPKGNSDLLQTNGVESP